LLAFYLSGNGTTLCCFSSWIKWESLEITIFSSITALLLWTLKRPKFSPTRKRCLQSLKERSQGNTKEREKLLEAFFIFPKKVFQNAGTEENENNKKGGWLHKVLNEREDGEFK